MPEISVVIPTYNESTYVDRLLEDLTKQSYKDFEVIVSDAQSKDGTSEVVTSFKDKLDIKFIESPPKGPGHGRNVGAKIARGEWLLFLDADVNIDDPNFIRTILTETEKRGWNTSQGKMAVKGASVIERFGTFLNYNYIKILSHTKHPVAGGYCIFTKRDVFEKNKGFNEKIRLGEDYDYVTRVGTNGFGFVEETYYYVDLRRFKEEGIMFPLKATLNEIYRHSRGYRVDKNLIEYKFGKHPKRK